jgi:ABC-type Na+ efflux pump permease subunit
MNDQGAFGLVSCVFRREMRAFFQVKWLWIFFVFQPFLVAGLSVAIYRNVLPVLLMNPEVLTAVLSKQLSTLLISFSLMSILHVVQKTVVMEKANGLLDTLLTTPLTIRQLVCGKALQLGVLAYAMGLLLAVLDIGVLLCMVGDATILTLVPWHYWVFALVVAPVIVVGILLVVVAAALAVKDVRTVMLPYTLGVAALLSGVTAYRSAAAEAGLLIGLTALGVGCHLGWWVLGNCVSRERVVSR